MWSVTEPDSLRFDSIFDLLIRLGFTEDQKHERMVAPGGTHMVAFAQTGGRSVAEFVRWGYGERALVALSDRPPSTAAERATDGGIPAMKSPTCPNVNHRRANAPVWHCPNCGGAGNGEGPTKNFHKDNHAKQRRQRNTFRLDCGKRFIR